MMLQKQIKFFFRKTSARIPYLVLIIGLIIHIVGCVPPEYGEKSFSGFKLDLNDKTIQHIYNLLERQSSDSLVIELQQTNPQYRLCALHALGSLRNAACLDSVAKLLNDKFNPVRCEAAFVLGELGEGRAEKILVAAYAPHDTTSEGMLRNAAILRAVGKCGSRSSQTYLCQISTFRPTDTLLLAAQTEGLMRFGLRDSFTIESIKKLVDFTNPQRYASQIRLRAAFGLSRAKTTFDTTVTNVIAQHLVSEPTSDVRIFLAKILGKSIFPSTTVEPMATQFKTETDINVKLALVNACQAVHFEVMNPILQPLLSDKNEQLSQAVAQFYKNFSPSKTLPMLRNILDGNEILPATRFTLWAAVMKQNSFSPRLRDSIAGKLIQLYRAETSDYNKVRIMRALATSPYNYDFFEEEAFNTKNIAAVRTEAAQTLCETLTSPNFKANFRGFSIGVSNRLRDIVFRLVNSGDAGLAALAATALESPAIGLKKLNLKDSIPMLYQAMQRFKAPNESETIEAILNAINFISDSVALQKPKSSFAKPIDWSLLRTVNTNSTATVFTARGSFKIQLLLQDAPISVLNFITLARSNYFNNKFFHRVVPLHVVQTGCPRGDGYGSLDYTISTEIGNVDYAQSGMVGMARDGLHTECSQWFVTTVPALHLDDNYTIFGKVIDGMNVVNQIALGDVVERVVID